MQTGYIGIAGVCFGNNTCCKPCTGKILINDYMITPKHKYVLILKVTHLTFDRLILYILSSSYVRITFAVVLEYFGG